MRITLRKNQRLFINGAVLRADRKVSLELLNDASFLLEQHVLQAEQVTTPVRRLYFITQLMLMEPADAPRLITLFSNGYEALLKQQGETPFGRDLAQAGELVRAGRYFEALKALRLLFRQEDDVAVAPLPEELPIPKSLEHGDPAHGNRPNSIKPTQPVDGPDLSQLGADA